LPILKPYLAGSILGFGVCARNEHARWRRSSNVGDFCLLCAVREICSNCELLRPRRSVSPILSILTTKSIQIARMCSRYETDYAKQTRIVHHHPFLNLYLFETLHHCYQARFASRFAYIKRHQEFITAYCTADAVVLNAWMFPKDGTLDFFG
jgi:hypothetical protein